MGRRRMCSLTRISNLGILIVVAMLTLFLKSLFVGQPSPTCDCSAGPNSHVDTRDYDGREMYPRGSDAGGEGGVAGGEPRETGGVPAGNHGYNGADGPGLTNTSQAGIYSQLVTQEMIETLKAPLPALLSDYRNPCWYEPVPEGLNYTANYFPREECQNRRQITNTFKTLQQELDAMPADQARSRLRCYPGFYLLGYTKSGTSSLYWNLFNHVEGFVGGAMKESQYWVRRRFGIVWAMCRGGYYGPKATFSDYLDLYDGAAKVIQEHVETVDGKEYHPWITTEFTPANSWLYPGWRSVIGNEGLSEPRFTLANHLHGVWPKTKFVAILRNPIKRAKSHFLHLHKGHKWFAARIDKEMGRFNDCIATGNTSRGCAYGVGEKAQLIIAGMYYIYLKDFLEVFPREQLHIIRMDDYAADTVGVIKGVADFLGLRFKEGGEEALAEKTRERRKTRTSHVLTGDAYPETSRMLKEFYRPWNEKLAALLKDDKWLEWNTLDESQTI